MPQCHSNPRYEQALAYLLGRIDYERSMAPPLPGRDFHLEQMRELLRRLGSPHERLKIVHVAGTKGKGSTSAMLAAVLTAAGYRTGLYTSPHLDRLEERVRIDGQPCSGDELAALVERVRPVVEQMDDEARQRDSSELGPTYFDITTAMAFLHCAQLGTDVAVVEVGLGGRLDSTNVCTSLVSVITSISFDHTRQLGSTLAAIAREKAGIIKPGVPVISGVVQHEPRAVIEEAAAECHSELRALGRDFNFAYHPPRNLEAAPTNAPCGTLDFEETLAGSTRRIRGVELGLLGRHQAANAAVALATLTQLEARGLRLPETSVRQGLAEMKWPARIEIVSRRPMIIVDAAHNTASIECLLQTLNESFRCRCQMLVFATTQDKDVRGILQLLLPHFEAVILTRYTSNPRSVDPAELDLLAAELSPIPRHICPDPQSAWDFARQQITPEHLVCVTGSFFLAAEMRAAISARPASIPDELTTASL